MTVSDDEIWARCQRGEINALGELFRRHYARVYGYAFRSTGDHQRADDIASVVFAIAWERRLASVEPGKVGAWLVGIATNVLRSQRRAVRNHRYALERIRHEMPEHTDDGHIASRVDDERRVQAMLRELKGLPRRDRELIVLCWWSEFSYQDAADVLGIPIGTVRSRLSRLRVRLADHISPDVPPITNGAQR